MVIRLEHIGIAVKDMEQANAMYEKLLGTAPYKMEPVASENVLTSFFQTGDAKVELVAATDPSSPIAAFIERKGEGIHHIAFEVDNIQAEMKRLSAEGFKLLNEEPKHGADNKLFCFFHPKTTNGVLIELTQEKTTENQV